MKQLIDFFRDKKIVKVLDVGTGTGDFIKELQTAFIGSKITGIDPNSESLQMARQKYPEVEFNEMTAENLIFEQDGFDAASISMTLHHLPDVQKALSEMQRVVKSGGWIIVAELFSDNLNPAQENHKFYHHFRSKIDRLNGISHNNTFSKKEILEMVRTSGVDIQQYFEVGNEKKPILNLDGLEDRVKKMEAMLESIKHLAEYDLMKLQVEEFRDKVNLFGFQPATRIVIIGKVSK